MQKLKDGCTKIVKTTNITYYVRIVTNHLKSEINKTNILTSKNLFVGSKVKTLTFNEEQIMINTMRGKLLRN